MDTVLVCGGCLQEEFARNVIEHMHPDCVIGIDRGLNFCYRNHIRPDYILGDFDSIDKEVLAYYESQPDVSVKRYQRKRMPQTRLSAWNWLSRQAVTGFFFWALREEG